MYGTENTVELTRSEIDQTYTMNYADQYYTFKRFSSGSITNNQVELGMDNLVSPGASIGTGMSMTTYTNNQFQLPSLPQATLHSHLLRTDGVISGRCQRRPKRQRKNKTPQLVPDIQFNTVPEVRLPFWILTGLALNNLPNKMSPVKDIYAFIEKYFPYHKNLKTNWKNSVRHCLAYSRFFKKIGSPDVVNPSPLTNVPWEFNPKTITAFWEQLELAAKRYSGPAAFGLIPPEMWSVLTNGRALTWSTDGSTPKKFSLRKAVIRSAKSSFSPISPSKISLWPQTYDVYRSSGAFTDTTCDYRDFQSPSNFDIAPSSAYNYHQFQNTHFSGFTYGTWSGYHSFSPVSEDMLPVQLF